MLDGFWKFSIYRFFADFISFFMPELADQIDWEVPIEYLDKELQKLFPEQVNARRVDQLIRVQFSDGNSYCILIHIEIQGYHDPHFPKRMFRYFTHISEVYEFPVFSFALITEALTETLRPNYYRLPTVGIENIFRYHSRQPANYTTEELLASQNPFALVMAAIKETASDSKAAQLQRPELIRNLARKLRMVAYTPETIKHFFLFLRMILRLNDAETEDMKKYAMISNGVSARLGLLDDPEAIAFFKDEIEAIRHTARLEGNAEGKIEGKIETALRLQALGIPEAVIQEATGLKPEEWNQYI